MLIINSCYVLFAQFQDFDPHETCRTCKNASFHCALKTSLTVNCLCNMIIYFTFVFQYSTGKITKAFIVNTNLVSLFIAGRNEK